jgi:hypothetical protein
LRLRLIILVLVSILISLLFYSCESEDTHQINDNPHNLPYTIGLTIIKEFSSDTWYERDTTTIDSIYLINGKKYVKFSNRSYIGIENGIIYSSDSTREEIYADFSKEKAERYWNTCTTWAGNDQTVWLCSVINRDKAYQINFNGKDTTIKVLEQKRYFVRPELRGKDPNLISDEELENSLVIQTEYISINFLTILVSNLGSTSKLIAAYILEDGTGRTKDE